MPNRDIKAKTIEEIMNELNKEAYIRFLDQFKPGTIYLELSSNANDITNFLYFKYSIRNMIYCVKRGELDISTKNQIIFYGRSVTCGTIKWGNIVDGTIDFWHDFNNHCDKYFNVPNTEYGIEYDCINNVTLDLEDSTYDLFKDKVPVYVPLHSLSELEQAYFIVREDEYKKNNTKFVER